MYRCHRELSDWVQNNALLAYLDQVLSCSLGSTLFSYLTLYVISMLTRKLSGNTDST